MDIFLAVLASVCFFAGIVGCVVPLLPGPPLGFLGLLLLHFTRFADFSPVFLISWALIATAVTLADLYLPVWITRKYGGTRAAAIGCGIGLLAGLFLGPPIGIIVCPFLGALIGELLHDHVDSRQALRVALGTFVAFMLGTGLKLIVCGFMIFYGVRALFT